MKPGITPDAQHLLEQLELIDRQFEFYNTECDKLELDFEKNEEDKFAPKYEEIAEEIAYKFLELEARYESDKKTYEGLLNKIRLHFKTKYNIDIKFDL